MKPAEVVKSLAALAQDSRLAVFRLLVEAGPEGLAAGVIAGRLGLPAATASFHLAQLTNAGLLKSRTAGRYVIYAVDLARMNEVLAYLTENCCGGTACEVASVVPVAVARPARTRRSH